MKSLKFKSYLIEQIKNGTKTVTWRLFDDKDLQKNDHFLIINSDTSEDCGEAIITEAREKKLKDITPEDYAGHEEYRDSEEMLQTYKNYYGDKVNWGTIVKMVSFKLL